MATGKLTIVYRDPNTLKAYTRNTRTHSDEQIEKVRASIREFGFTNPVLLKDDDETIGAGHARTRAAILEGVKEVPTITLHGLTNSQWRAYVIADNQLAITGSGWSMEMLRAELGDLKLDGFDLNLVGFDEDFLGKLFVEPASGNTDPDDVPEAGAEPVSEFGDVWRCGVHRVVCGDSTAVESVDAALNGMVPMLMVTDPPYGVKLNPGNRAKGMNDGATRATGTIKNDDRSDWREAWALFPGVVAYVWHAFRTQYEVEDSLRAAGFETRSQIVWKKTRPVQSPGNINPKTMGYNPQHECAFYAVKKGGKVEWAGDRSQSTVWEIDHLKSDTGHGSQKPVECMRRPIVNNSSIGQAIYEPFLGSGTTMIACEMESRVCCAIELDPAYVDVSVLRWQAYTGKAATLEATGETFVEVMARRRPEMPLKPGKVAKGGRG